MPKTDDDPLGPAFEWRLRAALDRVQPRFSRPRYANATGRVHAWRVAPMALAAGLAGVLVLSASAVTGSANPAVWTSRIVTAIEASPTMQATPVPEPTAVPQAPKAVPAQATSQAPGHEASPKPDPSDRAYPTGRPEPSDDEGGSSYRPRPSGSPSGYGSPNPTPRDD